MSSERAQRIKSQFYKASEIVTASNYDRVGIGTLGEKTLHRVLKYSIEPDENFHEIKIGRYYADILKDKNITEIQSAGFNTLRKKLDYFLQEHTVRIVYPIAYTKHIAWIDTDTGEITKKRKSPKKGKVYDCFYELYKIKQHLCNQNLKISLILVDVIEYRRLDGWSEDKKKGATRHERIPERIEKIIDIDNVSEYQKLIPQDLHSEFTTKDYKEKTSLSLSSARTAVHILCFLGLIEKVGKRGRLILYKRT